MKQPNPDLPRLTKNDQRVLKSIIQHAKLPDSDRARKMGLSPQAVLKIRKKLEDKGIIKGYQPVLDLKKLGIGVLGLVGIEIGKVVWNSSSDEQISERLKRIPYVIDAYKITSPDITHIILLGFKDLSQMDKYLRALQTKFNEEIGIHSVYTFPIENVITQSQVGLLYEMLNKDEFKIEQFFLESKKH